MANIKLIVGLGNPGPQYSQTRHNAGAWYVEALANDYSIPLQLETKFFGHVGRGLIGNQDCRLLIPNTFMNLSGKAVGALATFYKILPDEILVAHDELDIDPGTVKLKKSGGHGGHNGLRDIIKSLANCRDFYRLRIGIGHPGNKNQVHNYVLGKASPDDQRSIDESIDKALRHTSDIITGQHDKVMQSMHAFKA
ncbi:aminoacyl-tRNA hydrolase [Aliikangiella coralliicola]|uniref:Peptidyl-tRNA hydrolase n=1 Tax=Aliikangiella coralliicola TaxID=2592383 RepID=A0A545TW26_9GAMM|nr:aminoacyl-tRNA hydrolase [Aliikangiella coralliicola]TQV81402.1 aminoacyl-tRNA hydrolase [Aliikangiella coralliicola]